MIKNVKAYSTAVLRLMGFLHFGRFTPFGRNDIEVLRLMGFLHFGRFTPFGRNDKVVLLSYRLLYCHFEWSEHRERNREIPTA